MSLSVLMSYRMWQRNWDVFRALWLYNIGGVLVEPLFLLLAVGFGIGSLVSSDIFDGLSYGQFIAPGIIAGYAMFHATGECTWGTYLRMENQHTFDGILATPMSAGELTVGELLWGATRGLMSVAAVLVMASAFGLIRTPMSLALLPIGLLVGFTFSAVAMCYTAVARSINVLESFYTLVLTPMFFFSGAFYPVSNMPTVVQPFIWALPLTPAVRLMRDIVTEQMGMVTLASFVLVVLWGVVFTPLAMWLMRRRLVK